MGCSSSNSLSKVQPNYPLVECSKGSARVQPNDVVVIATPSGKNSATVLPQNITDDCGLVYHEQKQNADNLVSLCKRGKISDIDKLLKSEAVDINVTGMWDNTPLIASCQYGHKLVAMLLLEQASIDVNHMNENGATALLFASLEGFTDVVAKLLMSGADVNPAPAVVYNPSTDRSNFMSPISAAVVNGYVEIAAQLLEAGSEANLRLQQKNEHPGKDSPTLIHGVSLLMLACKHQRDDIITLLLSRDADSTTVDSEGSSVVHYACRSGSASDKVLKTLVNACPSISVELLCATDHSQSTALHYACEHKCVETVKILLDPSRFSNPANVTTFVNIINTAGLSALHIAIKKRSVDLVKLLLESKADPHMRLAGVEKPTPSAFEMAQKLRPNSDIHKLICASPVAVTNTDETSRPCTPTLDKVLSSRDMLAPIDTSHPECVDGGARLDPPGYVAVNLDLCTPQKSYDRDMPDSLEYSRITNAPKKESKSASKDVRPPSPVGPIKF